MITKGKFAAFVKIQASGETNMWNANYVCPEAGLTLDEYHEIMTHYKVYEEMYNVHVEDYEEGD